MKRFLTILVALLALCLVLSSCNSAKEEENNISNFRNSRENLVSYGKTVSEEFATSYLIKKKFIYLNF